MVCYHPLHAFLDGYTKDGKRHFKITSSKVSSVMYDNGHWFLSADPGKYSNNNYIDIPCGKCVGCRIDYSREWALRCQLESLYHSRTMFLTLTYDDFHVPHSSYCDYKTGEIRDVLTLKPDDFTLFMKRLRYYYSEKYGRELRYYACGEYGSSTLRPHYHAIVFGLDLDDLKLERQSGTGHDLYSSDLVSKAWNKGYVLLSDSNFDTCAYVARYVMKKRKGEDSAEYEAFNIVPEFVRMSRRPGIAKQYYDDHKHDIYKYDKIILDGKIFRPPSYFDDLYSKEFPDDFAKVLDSRVNCAIQSDNVKEFLFGDKYKRLTREEIVKMKSLSKLVREL